ncbi:unnamed protein product [Onchocerca ochengi]|uniref:Major sperm protein n=1 Tax=Onchocerca ochengi TaxID=42157 RepID=A0A182EEJ9_ONCOC|nr:unnamed protein product [Onchocerca ochengi]
MMIAILYGLICFVILPLLLFTSSLISCGETQRKPVREEKSSTNRTITDSSRIRKTRAKKSETRTKSVGSTASTKSQKLSESKSKTGKSTKSSEELKSSPVIRSVERLSSRPRRSSRLQRFRKLPTVKVERSIARNLDEKFEDGLKIEPKSLNWNISGGVQRVYLTNPSNERRAIKVKCSDNHLYRVSHVFGFIEPGQMFTIDVVRQNGGSKTDKMVFLWTEAMETDKNASMLFKKLSVYPLLVLPLTVNNHDS